MDLKKKFSESEIAWLDRLPNTLAVGKWATIGAAVVMLVLASGWSYLAMKMVHRYGKFLWFSYWAGMTHDYTRAYLPHELLFTDMVNHAIGWLCFCILALVITFSQRKQLILLHKCWKLLSKK